MEFIHSHLVRLGLTASHDFRANHSNTQEHARARSMCRQRSRKNLNGPERVCVCANTRVVLQIKLFLTTWTEEKNVEEKMK